LSYTTYTTKALVCGNFEQNTSDKSFLLFTRDAGMLFATAKSVREEVSKQRNALQDFTRLNISLIKGKTGWRVGSVEALQNDFSLAANKEVRGSVVLFYRLLRRFIRGEEAHPDLFDFSVAALDELLAPQTNRRLLDLFIQIRILLLLGYVDETAVPDEIRTSTLADISALESSDLIKKLEILANKAAESSHL
jgi:recombinational DNA repair protein (RecF pathway)